ncbi:YqkE family protein [Paenibacillus dakarensis]|uniref:YqkE family protein n=1 Tax=Paenibacillus dakarensis TaxID=1527293 RepID=UPI0006D5B1D3|nr:YqkE family protein [Paenibacillus dakarensis]
MAKKKGKTPVREQERVDRPATLKDMLNPEVIERLKAQADSLKADEAKRLEQERLKREEAKKAEQKRLDNDFEHLLKNSSMDWHKYK